MADRSIVGLPRSMAAGSRRAVPTFPPGWAHGLPWMALAVVAAASGVYVAAGAGLARDLLFVVVAWTPLAAIATATRWHRLDQPAVWRLIAAGLAASAVGDTITCVYHHVLHRPPVPGPANLCYLLAFPLVIAALVVLGRSGRHGRDVGGLLDLAILATGLGLLSWGFLVRPMALPSDVPLTGRLLSAAYALFSALVLALLLRLLTAPGGRGLAYWLLVVAAGLCLVSTLAYHTLTLRNGAALPSSHLGVTLADGSLMLGLGFVNAAALHPSTRQLSPARPAGEPEPPPTPWRLAVLAVAALVAPATLAAQLLTGAPVAGWATAVGGAAMSLLVLARMTVLVRQVHAQAARLAELADTDVLTGLGNRRAWQRQLERELARAARQGVPLALAVLDLDRFKSYNDAHGHPAGDRMLKRSARAWRARLRAGDVLARIGGEEFAVLLPGCTPPAAIEVAEDLRRATPAGQTVSVGVACWVGTERDDELVARADAALYEAKRAGRDRVVGG